MTVASIGMPPKKPPTLLGHAKPRIAPPTPARTLAATFEAVATDIGLDLIPWQKTSGRYLYAVDQDDRWLYPEVCELVARQQGKTEKLVPHIVTRIEMNRRIMHSAQTREYPRHIFGRVATIMEARHGLGVKIRRGAGQETIELPGGGLYRIVAPSRGGSRGSSNDDLIVDEVRELKDEEFTGAAQPTLAASDNPQTLYLSNAGETDSLVLNKLRLRADSDPSLAWIEWSASPERSIDDREGWLEANPAIGHFPGTLRYLERMFQSYKLAGSLAIFETEHLCRWVITTRAQLIDAYSWMNCKGDLEEPARPSMTFSMDPNGERAAVALAWRQSDDTIGLRLPLNVTGHPINTDALGADIRKMAASLGVAAVGFDPMTDAALAKFIKKPKPESISGQKFANATAQFVNIVNAGKLQWADCDPVTDDLTWTTRKNDREAGSFEAVRAEDDHPIPASLAAIRAVWLAAAPPLPRPKVM